MITGRDNFDLLNQHVYQAQSQQEDTSRRLEDLHRQLDAVRLELSGSYRQLAKLQLDDLQAQQAISSLNETDQMIFGLVQNLKRSRLNLKEQIKASTSDQSQLNEQRQGLARQRDEAGEAMQRQLEQTHKRISETEAYRQQQEKTQQAVAVAKQAEEKATRAENDRLEKGKPYEARPPVHVFMEPALSDAGLPGRLACPAIGQLGGKNYRFSAQPVKLLHASGIAPPAPGARHEIAAGGAVGGAGPANHGASGSRSGRHPRICRPRSRTLKNSLSKWMRTLPRRKPGIRSY